MKTDFRDQLGDPDLRGIYDYWNGKRQGGRLPMRSDLDPTELRGLLRHVNLAEVIDGGARIRYRLVGTEMVERWGGDFTGKHVDEIMQGSYRDFLMKLFRDTVEQRCAVFSRSRFRWDVGRSLDTSRLFLPLQGEDGAVAMVLIGQIFGNRAGEEEPVVFAEDGVSHVETVRLMEKTA